MCREMQHPRPSEAQALERALPQNLSLSPSEQLIMEVGICFSSYVSANHSLP